MAEKSTTPRTPRKPIAEMDLDEMRALLVKQAGTARDRGIEYRKKMRRNKMTRFSIYIPDKVVPEVRQMVEDFLKQRRLAAAGSLAPVTVEVDATATADDAIPDARVQSSTALTVTKDGP